VIFGHTHRRGPLDGEPGWELPGGPRLVNTGSWVFARALVGSSSRGSVFWPGTVVMVDDDDPPRPRHLLDDLERDELRTARG